MNKLVRLTLYCLVIGAIIAAALTSVYCSDSNFWTPNGVWSVLPPIIAIVLAFATRNVLIALLAGLLSAAYLMALRSLSPLSAVPESFEIATQQMLFVVTKPFNAGVLLQCGVIGGLVGLLTAGGGVRAIAELFAKFARGPVSAQIVSWILGFFIFFDDYANVQIRGPIARPIADRNRVSREKLAFILDATAAPIAGVALVSTWIGTELAYINSGLVDAGLTETYSPYGLFVASIPYRFYNVLMLAFVFLSAVTLRDFGAMRRAEVLARQGRLRDMDRGEISVEQALDGDDASDSKDSKDAKRNSLFVDSLFAIVPLLVLVCSAFWFFYSSGRLAILEGGDPEQIALVQTTSPESLRAVLGKADAAVSIFRAALLAGIVAFCLNVLFRRNTAAEAIVAWLNGVKSLVFTFAILILAWALSTCINRENLGAAQFLVSALSEGTPTFLLPSLVFILAAIVSFATGTSYGTMAIITPLAIPFANALAPGDYSYLVACVGSVLTGAIFGDHSSPISDTTILSATSARCGMLEHVGTQLGYAIFVAIVSVLFGFLPVGLGAPIAVVLPVALVVLALLLWKFGKKTPEWKPENNESTDSRG